jgi:hypothetical protein
VQATEIQRQRRQLELQFRRTADLQVQVDRLAGRADRAIPSLKQPLAAAEVPNGNGNGNGRNSTRRPRSRPCFQFSII